jgi:hypothetical protein
VSAEIEKRLKEIESDPDSDKTWAMWPTVRSLIATVREQMARAEGAEAKLLAKSQDEGFHPDWSLLKATQASLREHMRGWKAEQVKREVAEGALQLATSRCEQHQADASHLETQLDDLRKQTTAEREELRARAQAAEKELAALKANPILLVPPVKLSAREMVELVESARGATIQVTHDWVPRERAEIAEKACAAMRAALEAVLEEEWGADWRGINFRSNGGKVDRMAIAALASDAGRDWVPREELEAAKVEINRLEVEEAELAEADELLSIGLQRAERHRCAEIVRAVFADTQLANEAAGRVVHLYGWADEAVRRILESEK